MHEVKEKQEWVQVHSLQTKLSHSEELAEATANCYEFCGSLFKAFFFYTVAIF